ncbi:MAG: DUF11 domain-containing protein [Coleofasciculus sp. B1-GNL1-01]|uniref:hypothetical protein n=1 Tax=Coleofasciculus sp. B1-GNL1-01 TaxID=3068484 RepID=UPI0032F46E82
MASLPMNGDQKAPLMAQVNRMQLGHKRFKQGWFLGFLALFMGLGWTQGVRAEGSADLIDNGGDRPYLEYRNDDSAGIPRRTIIQVYVRAGETINLGSSAIGIGDGDIRYTAPEPDGSTNTCSSSDPGTGLIPNLATEEAIGEGNPPASYTPCQVTVQGGQTGIWEIEFISPNEGSNENPAPIGAREEWTQEEDVGFIAAWDVTVVDSTGSPIPGRVFANYLALNMGSNGRSLNSQLTIQTNQGYQYEIDLNGIDPFGFIFFANSKGFLDSTTGEPSFESINQSEIVINQDEILEGSTLLDPSGESDNEATNDITHKVFLNQPAMNMPASAMTRNGETFLRPDLVTPEVSNFTFTGTDGTPNQVGQTLGGNFNFDANVPGTYSIIIDLNNNGMFDDGIDRQLIGRTVAGSNQVFWDGLDGQGNPVPVNSVPYQATIEINAGEAHFPFIDAENNPNGIILRRLRLNGPSGDETIIYYDDTPVGGETVLPEGEDSSGGGHVFSSDFGNEKGIDTWINVPSTPLGLQEGILVQVADLSITKTDQPDPIVAGEQITYTLTVTNEQPPQGETYSDVTGATVTDTIPDDITNVTWNCEITSAPDTGACGTASGTGNTIDLTVDLNVGATATITVNGTVSPTASGTLNNTATVDPPDDTLDPNEDNNTDPEDTTIEPSPVQPVGIKSVELSQDTDGSGSLTQGDIVEYTITYTNSDPSIPITDFQAVDEIDTTSLQFVEGSYNFTASGAGTTVTANSTYNGTSDPNLNNSGTLGADGGQVVIQYQAEVIAAAGAEIRNQAVARSNGGTVDESITDAFAKTGDVPQISDDGVDQGNLEGTGDDEPTLLVVQPLGNPNLRLVKRVTNIIRNGAPISGVNFNTVEDDPEDEDDNILSQTSVQPVGISSLPSESSLQSGDEVEYTIYFLSDGTAPANGITICDAIPEETTFITDSFNPGQGILVNQGGTNTNQSNQSEDDRGEFLPPLSPVTSPCPNLTNPNGSVLINLGDVPITTPDNVGFVRFRVRVD